MKVKLPALIGLDNRCMKPMKLTHNHRNTDKPRHLRSLQTGTNKDIIKNSSMFDNYDDDNDKNKNNKTNKDENNSNSNNNHKNNNKNNNNNNNNNNDNNNKTIIYLKTLIGFS